MKVLMIIFGLLDVVLILTRLPRMPAYVRGAVQLEMAPAICIALLVTLALSALGFITRRRWVFPLSYAQFPFRIALSFMSLGVVAELLLPATASTVLSQAVWMSCAAIEGIRLGLTVMLQKEMKKSPTSAWSLRGKSHNFHA